MYTPIYSICLEGCLHALCADLSQPVSVLQIYFCLYSLFFVFVFLRTSILTKTAWREEGYTPVIMFTYIYI